MKGVSAYTKFCLSFRNRKKATFYILILHPFYFLLQMLRSSFLLCFTFFLRGEWWREEETDRWTDTNGEGHVWKSEYSLWESVFLLQLCVDPGT